MDRAYSLLTIKSFDDEQRTIEGIASTPEPDRRGDVLDPKGAQFTLPMPLLWQHDPDLPIGQVVAARVTDAGIAITAKLARVDEPGRLKDRLDEAWQSIKAQLVRGLSVGLKPITASPIKKSDPFGPLHIARWHWAETSAVTLPMNVTATITAIKSAAAPSRSTSLPGDSGLPRVAFRKAETMQTYAEQIAANETTRGTVVASMQELMTKAGTDGATLDPEDAKRYDGLALQVKSLDAHLVRLREMEAINASAATPIPPTPGAPAPSPVVQVKSMLPKGTTFVRYAMALLAGRGDSMRALDFAKRFKDSTPEVELMVKAAVAPGDTVTPAWAGALVQMKNATDEFLELLRPATIIGKIPGFRQVPFNTQVPVQTGGGTYAWVGQGAAKPVGKLALTTVGLGFSKAAGIIVITDELAKLSSPSAEGVVRADMIAGMAAFLDMQLIDPAVVLVPNVSPASITNGAQTAASVDNAYADLHAIASFFASNGIPLAGMTLIMSETNALSAGMTRDGQGNKVFPGLGAGGGTAEGFNVIASNAAGTNVIGVHPAGILYADEGGVQIDVSREASVMMDSAPVPGTTPFTSLWQNNLIGLRAERMINWNRARPNSVYYLTGAVYVPTVAVAAGAAPPTAGLGARRDAAKP
jgi:HK97 family phage major capsid protein/HK97 family phage prohead protease